MDVRACAGLVDTTMSEGIVRPTSQDLSLLSFQKGVHMNVTLIFC